MNQLPPVKTLLVSVSLQVAFYIAVLVVCWLIAKFYKPAQVQQNKSLNAFKFAALHALWILPITLGLASLCEWVADFFKLGLPPQPVLEWLKPGAYPIWVQTFIGLIALCEAPLVEELTFRKYLFGWACRGMNTKAAAIFVSIIFAAVHLNAVTFPPLLFLALAFTWLYVRTGSIFAPMLAHFLFNTLNLVMCVCGLAS